MQREQFVAKLNALAEEAVQSEDRAVQQSAVVLLGLRGSIIAGEDFFDAFIDNVVVVIKNQRDVLVELLKKKGG